MKKKAIFPGSFDPFTIGHESLVIRSLNFFDEILIAVGYNPGKNSFFSPDIRVAMIKDIFKDEKRIQVEKYHKLTVDYCKEKDIHFIIRGLRTAADFEYERAIAQINHFMHEELETIFLLTETEHTPVNSTILRDILRHGGDISQFIPEKLDIKKYL